MKHLIISILLIGLVGCASTGEKQAAELPNSPSATIHANADLSDEEKGWELAKIIDLGDSVERVQMIMGSSGERKPEEKKPKKISVH